MKTIKNFSLIMCLMGTFAFGGEAVASTSTDIISGKIQTDDGLYVYDQLEGWQLCEQSTLKPITRYGNRIWTVEIVRRYLEKNTKDALKTLEKILMIQNHSRETVVKRKRNQILELSESSRGMTNERIFGTVQYTDKDKHKEDEYRKAVEDCKAEVENFGNVSATVLHVWCRHLSVDPIVKRDPELNTKSRFAILPDDTPSSGPLRIFRDVLLPHDVTSIGRPDRTGILLNISTGLIPAYRFAGERIQEYDAWSASVAVKVRSYDGTVYIASMYPNTEGKPRQYDVQKPNYFSDAVTIALRSHPLADTTMPRELAPTQSGEQATETTKQRNPKRKKQQQQAVRNATKQTESQKTQGSPIYSNGYDELPLDAN